MEELQKTLITEIGKQLQLKAEKMDTIVFAGIMDWLSNERN